MNENCKSCGWGRQIPDMKTIMKCGCPFSGAFDTDVLPSEHCDRWKKASDVYLHAIVGAYSRAIERSEPNMESSKLDVYDYQLLPGIIRIGISGTNDPVLVDILSELDKVDGKIYVEGRRFDYLNEYNIVVNDNVSYMDLHVLPAGLNNRSYKEATQ